MNKTPIPKAGEVPQRWLLLDAENRILGRLASQVAMLLMGKNKPQFIRHLNCGDNVIVVNVDKVKVTGRKSLRKMYFHYTGYPGGLRSEALGKRLTERPEKLFREAVSGMLPKNRLGRGMLAHLHVYRGSQHAHQAQKPEAYKLS